MRLREIFSDVEATAEMLGEDGKHLIASEQVSETVQGGGAAISPLPFKTEPSDPLPRVGFTGCVEEAREMLSKRPQKLFEEDLPV